MNPILTSLMAVSTQLARPLVLATCTTALMASAIAPGKTAPPLPTDSVTPALSDLQLIQLAQPMPISLQLTQFTCHNADEDSWYSNGDEPYLFVAAIYVDGTTIKLSELSTAKARIKSPTATHGNLGKDHVKGGQTFGVPQATGQFSSSILPIDGLPEALGKEKSLIGLVVIAMEEDATPTSAANAGRKALVNVLQKELDRAIQTVTMPDVNILKTKISNAMKAAIKKESLSSISGIFSVVDPDDYVGADFEMWSYKQIEQAGSAGLPINMTFKSEGVHYSIKGLIKRS
jgi:hypothetical protein